MYIKSGTASESVRKLYDTLDSLSNKLKGWTFDKSKMQTTSDGALVYLMKSEDEWMPDFKIRFSPLQQSKDGNTFSSISFKAPNNRINSDLMKFVYQSDKSGKLTPDSSSIEQLNQLIDEYEDDVLLKLVNSSNHLNLKLSKINGSTKVISAITTYNIVDSLSDIRTLLDDTEFIDNVPNNCETCYDVDSTESVLDYQIDDSVFSVYSHPYGTTLPEILYVIFSAIQNISYLAYNCTGSDNIALKSAYESLKWDLEGMLSQICEICVEKTGHCPNLLELIGSDCMIISGDDYISKDIVSSILQPIVDTVEFYKLSIIDDTIVYLLSNFLRTIHRWKDYVFNPLI